jgi:hypothetical protein
LGRVVRGVLVSFIACWRTNNRPRPPTTCWRAPTTAYRKIDKQDQCHHGRRHPRAEHGAPQQKVRGSFFASSPGSILTSVEEIGRGNLRATDDLALKSLDYAAAARHAIDSVQHVVAARKDLWP